MTAAPACEPVPDAELDALTDKLWRAEPNYSLCRSAAAAIASLRQQNAELRLEATSISVDRLQWCEWAAHEKGRAEAAERERDELQAVMIRHSGHASRLIDEAVAAKEAAERERDELRLLLEACLPYVSGVDPIYGMERQIAYVIRDTLAKGK